MLIKECTKKKQNYFFDFLGPTRINPRSYVSPGEWRIRVTWFFFKKLFGKIFEKM